MFQDSGKLSECASTNVQSRGISQKAICPQPLIFTSALPSLISGLLPMLRITQDFSLSRTVHKQISIENCLTEKGCRGEKSSNFTFHRQHRQYNSLKLLQVCLSFQPYMGPRVSSQECCHHLRCLQAESVWIMAAEAEAGEPRQLHPALLSAQQLLSSRVKHVKNYLLYTPGEN